MIFLLAALICVEQATSLTQAQQIDRSCQEVVSSEEAFSHFRRSEFCLKMIDNCTKYQGLQFLSVISERYPHLLKKMSQFQENEGVGNPVMEAFSEYGSFCPATLRYVKVAGELGALFGNLSGKTVVEIGGGYGGQCRILSSLYAFKEYIIVDLPEVLELAKKYLEPWGFTHIRYLTPDQISLEDRYDLLISNYAFSECSYKTQISYVEKLFKRSQCGYLLCNELGYFRKKALQEYLIDSGISAEISPEIPLTSIYNYLLTWR